MKYTGVRNYCFTSFEKVPPKFINTKMAFMVYQREMCPETKKLHWQGYIEFKEKESIVSIKRMLNDKTIHLEMRKGTQQQCIDYCTKEESRQEGSMPVFFGKKKNQGQRTDLDGMLEMIEAGHTSYEVLREFRGNGMRHITHIFNCMESVWGKRKLDMEIIERREKNAKDFNEEDCAYFAKPDFVRQLDTIDRKENLRVLYEERNRAGASSRATSDSGDDNGYRSDD